MLENDPYDYEDVFCDDDYADNTCLECNRFRPPVKDHGVWIGLCEHGHCSDSRAKYLIATR